MSAVRVHGSAAVAASSPPPSPHDSAPLVSAPCGGRPRLRCRCSSRHTAAAATRWQRVGAGLAGAAGTRHCGGLRRSDGLVPSLCRCGTLFGWLALPLLRHWTQKMRQRSRTLCWLFLPLMCRPCGLSLSPLSLSSLPVSLFWLFFFLSCCLCVSVCVSVSVVYACVCVCVLCPSPSAAWPLSYRHTVICVDAHTTLCLVTLCH